MQTECRHSSRCIGKPAESNQPVPSLATGDDEQSSRGSLEGGGGRGEADSATATARRIVGESCLG